MRSPVKIILIVAALSCTALGFRHVQGQSEQELTQGRLVATANTSGSRPLEDAVVRAHGGSFALKNLTLTRVSGSTVLKGKIRNKTGRRYEQVSFEVRAYGRDGQLLRGLESKIIFAAHELKANASAPINYGHGVWLQGVPAEKIARIEISETGQGIGASRLARRIPLYSHAQDWKRYVEIEE